MPKLFDLTWKSSTQQPDLPSDVYPYQGPAIYRGDPYTIHFTLLDGEDPYVPTGDLLAQIRLERLAASATPGTPLAEFAVTVGGVDDNEVTIHLTPDQTKTLPDSGYWDLQEFDGDDPLGTWYTGRVKAWGDVTREVEA